MIKSFKVREGSVGHFIEAKLSKKRTVYITAFNGRRNKSVVIRLFKNEAIDFCKSLLHALNENAG